MKLKPLSAILYGMAILCSTFFLDGCKRDELEKPDANDNGFSGTLKSLKGEPISDASVFINGKETRTEKDGSFKIDTDIKGRYVVTIKKKGYKLISKVFARPVKDYPFKLEKAFTATIDPTKPNVIRDLNSATTCVGSGLQNLKFDEEYKKIPFVYDKKGNLVDFGWQSNMKDIFDYTMSAPVCNPGATIAIPANSIVNSSGKPVRTPVTISISTIDVQSPDGMPGDYTYQDESGSGVMVSMGAVAIELYSEKEYFNLDPKSPSQLSLPVESAMLKFNKDIPETIPVLYYDEKEGVWRQEKQQVGRYNRKNQSYETELHHLSAINMDYKMPDPTCFRLRQLPIAPSPVITPFRIGILSSTFGFKVSTTIGDESDDCFNRNNTNLHLVYNAPPPGEQVCIILTDNASPPTAHYGIIIQETPSTPYGATLDMTCPCNSTTVPPTTCNDGSGVGCDESLTGCDPFSPTCTNVLIQTFSADVVFAARNSGGANADVKWIFKNALPDGTPYTYTIAYEDSATPGTFTNMPGSPVADTYSSANPIEQVSITTPVASSRLRITINTINGVAPPAGTWTSNEVGL